MTVASLCGLHSEHTEVSRQTQSPLEVDSKGDVGAFSTKRRAPRALPSFLLQTRTKSSGVHAERVLWTLISTLRCFAQYTGVLISAVRRANINKGCKDCVDIVASLISVDPNGFIFGGMNPDLPKNYCIHFCYKTQGGVNTSFTLSPQLF